MHCLASAKPWLGKMSPRLGSKDSKQVFKKLKIFKSQMQTSIVFLAQALNLCSHLLVSSFASGKTAPYQKRSCENEFSIFFGHQSCILDSLQAAYRIKVGPEEFCHFQVSLEAFYCSECYSNVSLCCDPSIKRPFWWSGFETLALILFLPQHGLIIDAFFFYGENDFLTKSVFETRRYCPF